MDAYDAVRVLLPLNITVFCLDLSGSGLSEGQYITLGVRESEDLRSVMAYLRGTGARAHTHTRTRARLPPPAPPRRRRQGA